MKTLLRFVIVLFFFNITVNLNGQPWQLVRETENTQRLTAIAFPDSLHGWMVGNKPGDNTGYINSTDDGGESWTEQTSAVSDNLKDVHFMNDSTGFAIGSNSIQKTINGGADWSEIELDSLSMNPAFVSFDFVDSTGYAVGDKGILLKSSNGGEAWTELSPLTSEGFYHAVDFTNPDTGIVVGGYGTGQHALRTTDGADTWDSLDIDMPVTSTDGSLLDVTFVDDSVVYIVGRYGKVARSSDYGETWKEMSRIEIASGGVMENFAVYFKDADTGWVATTHLNSQVALINRTNDGGETWREELFFNQSPVVRINDLLFSENGTGWACGSQSGLTLNGEIIFKGTGEVNTSINLPQLLGSKVSLFQNHPNPFSSGTEIMLDLNEAAKIQLSVYASSGQLVKNLFEGNLPSGRHSYTFDAGSLPTGVYVSVLRIDGVPLSRKMLLSH